VERGRTERGKKGRDDYQRDSSSSFEERIMGRGGGQKNGLGGREAGGGVTDPHLRG